MHEKHLRNICKLENNVEILFYVIHIYFLDSLAFSECPIKLFYLNFRKIIMLKGRYVPSFDTKMLSIYFSF